MSASHPRMSPSSASLGDMEPFNPGVDGEAIRARHGNGPLLLFVGQLRARKGPHLLVEALPAIRERLPAARAIFVGPDYGQRHELGSRAAGLGVEDAVDVVWTRRGHRAACLLRGG